jgi:hypothetical protein
MSSTPEVERVAPESTALVLDLRPGLHDVQLAVFVAPLNVLPKKKKNDAPQLSVSVLLYKQSQ